ncbi:MAG: hypothetical protein BVN28_06595 [Nitrospira sp. ST-bin4]|nr:MAG: hypothetical protein BVN28_06595 [Nitrospira sp. ST-bin4]
MSYPTKGNAHITANRAAFMEAYARARAALTRIPGVLDVGFGHVQTGGEFRAGLGFLAFVREKRDVRTLEPAERIPGTFEGYRVDVRVPQKLREYETNPDYAGGNDQPETVIKGGIQIEPRKKSKPQTGPCMVAGTLGCIVRKRGGGDGDDNVYLLTNAHVLEGFKEDIDKCGPGDYVYHPYASKIGKDPGVRLGSIKYPLVKEPDFPYIDCGIARIDVGSWCCDSTCGPNRLEYVAEIRGLGPDTTPVPAYRNWIRDVRDVRGDSTMMVVVTRNARDEPTSDDAALRTALAGATDAHRVRKVGRSTGRTTGIVIGVNVLGVGHIDGRGPEVYLRELIEIVLDPAYDGGPNVPRGFNRLGRRNFAEDGDSGSIVVDNTNQAIGMIFGGPEFRMAGNDFHLSWACHIVPVLDKLQIYIPTKDKLGRNHGSDGATDGSGEALHAAGAALPDVPGKEVFASTSIATKQPRPDLEFDSVRERLRKSTAGDELFRAFTEHQREISCIVRHTRAGKVAWHRLQGPAFLASTIGHLRGESNRMPSEIRGVQRATLLRRLRTVLMNEGGVSLRQALERHGDTLLQLADAETFVDCLEILRDLETAEAGA